MQVYGRKLPGIYFLTQKILGYKRLMLDAPTDSSFTIFGLPL